MGPYWDTGVEQDKAFRSAIEALTAEVLQRQDDETDEIRRKKFSNLL